MMKKNNIWQRKHKFVITFAERGENFSMEVPHLPQWSAAIRFLRSRGFVVGKSDYYEKEFKCLSAYHRIGKKGDIACLLEIGADRIEVEFGHKKNLWEGENCFWSWDNDERTQPLEYLEKIRLEVEKKRFYEHISSYGFEFEPCESTLSPVEKILKGEANNTHIHGGATTLQEIKDYITPETYDYKQNSWDKNKKRIVCGDTKYFYNRWSRRLQKGVVWHNINNMWWVLLNDTEYTNIASFDLFDFDSSLPKKNPISQRRIEKLLESFEEKRDYLRCHAISKGLVKS